MATTTTAHPSSTGKWTWKDLLFPLISGAFGLFLTIAQIGYVFVPWMPLTAIHDPAVAVPAMHLWHYAQAGMHGLLLLALPLFLLVWRPRQRVLIMQFLLAAGGLMALLIVPVRTQDAIPVAVALVVLTVLYPYRRGLLARPAVQRLSRPLLGLTLLLSPFLLREAVRLVQWQIEGVGGEHAAVGHWIGAASIPLTLIIAGLLAATRQPGWRALGVVAGLSFLYLGAAALALPRHDGSWGTSGGAASIIAGATYLLLTYREGRERPAEARSTPWISPPAYATLAALMGVASLIVYAQVIRAGALGRQAGAAPDALAGLPAITSRGFSFDPEEIRAKAGETTTLRFDNGHNMPHSFDVDELDVHIPAAPGGQAVVVLKSAEPGRYTFYCGIPGHREAGMRGTLVVER